MDISSIFIKFNGDTPDSREGGSEQIREGAQETAERLFLSNTTGC
jgi:hypothetical protein